MLDDQTSSRSGLSERIPEIEDDVPLYDPAGSSIRKIIPEFSVLEFCNNQKRPLFRTCFATYEKDGKIYSVHEKISLPFFREWVKISFLRYFFVETGDWTEYRKLKVPFVVGWANWSNCVDFDGIHLEILGRKRKD